jgi:hypothetical protein
MMAMIKSGIMAGLDAGKRFDKGYPWKYNFY